MANPSDPTTPEADLDQARTQVDAMEPKLADLGVTGPETVGRENLGNLEPSDPISKYEQDLRDPDATIHAIGQDLHDHGVSHDESHTLEVEPDHGLDR